MNPDEPVRIVAYDPEWPVRFEAERAALEEAIGEWVVGGIHHVGSTAIPGIAAKPTIDILAGVRDLASSRVCIEQLARLDYLYAPYRAGEMHWFCKPSRRRRAFHLNLVPEASPAHAARLAFRDRLRADPALAAEYESLKRRLAARFPDDREAYTEAKAGFVEAVCAEGR